MTTEKTNSPPCTKRIDKNSSPLINKSDPNKKSAQRLPEISSSNRNSNTTLAKSDISNNNKATKNGISYGNKSISESIKDTSHSPINKCGELINSSDRISEKRYDTMKIIIREIPKSPHLSKDFSPNGERLRNSIRARRQERMQKQRSMRNLSNYMMQQSTCSSDAGSETSGFNLDDTEDFNASLPGSPFARINDLKVPLSRRRSRPYGDKGFIINVNDGLLTLNDVKDLNNCSDDFDSSCDTSLSYIDTDFGNTTANEINNPGSEKNTSLKTILSDNSNLSLIDNNENVKIEKKSLNELRENLVKCKSKLDSLEASSGSEAKKLFTPLALNCSKVSLSDIAAQKKISEIKINKYIAHPFANDVASDFKSNSIFNQLNPSYSPILNSRAGHTKTDTSLKKAIKNNSIGSDTSTKNSTKCIPTVCVQHSNKCNNKNYTNNPSGVLIERLTDEIIEKNPSGKCQIVQAELKAIEQPRNKGFFNQKINNKLNHSYVNCMYTDGASTESLAKKPPAPIPAPQIALKKRDGITKTNTRTRSDKHQSNKNSSQSSPPKRFL